VGKQFLSGGGQWLALRRKTASRSLQREDNFEHVANGVKRTSCIKRSRIKLSRHECVDHRWNSLDDARRPRCVRVKKIKFLGSSVHFFD
jgi:hypothetical protein